jgi:protein-S-isoprenylcysteine O-methyltransferase Ste14
MHAAGTNVRPDKPALAIVSGGPYRFSRNPMYLALCLMQIGVGFVIDGWIPVLFTIPLALMLHFGVVLREEAYLELKFGETYLQFKRRVRRWI